MGRRDVLTILERLKGHATVFFSTHILDDVQRVGDSASEEGETRWIVTAACWSPRR
jgi:ABC-type Na+ transport system ATPase subunit NatA